MAEKLQTPQGILMDTVNDGDKPALGELPMAMFVNFVNHLFVTDALLD